MDLERLLRAARDGEAHAWDQLGRALTLRLRRFFLRRRCGDADADDLMQTTLLIVHHKLPGLEVRTNLTAWVFGVASHQIADLHRARTRQGGLQALVAQVVPPTKTSPTSRVYQMELLSLVREEIERLPPYYRRAIEFELEEVSIQEYAQRENITVAAARVRRHRAHKLLAKRIAARQQPAALKVPTASTPTPC